MASRISAEQNKRYYKNDIKAAFASWMQGLPSSFNIDFENYEILKIGKKWGLLAKNATERQEDAFLNKWRSLIATSVFYLENKLKAKSLSGLSRVSSVSTTAKRKPATKKQGTGSTKKTIRKHEGINQRTGKLKKGYKYGANGRIVKVQTPAQKVRQTGSTHRADDLQRQAKRPGKRVSANGKTYYERRANRSDKGKLLAPNGGSPSDLCYRKNPDGSTTIYGSRGGDRPCPYGGRVGVRTVSTLQPQRVVSLSGARKKKPTAKQLAARAKFTANVRAGKYRK